MLRKHIIAIIIAITHGFVSFSQEVKFTNVDYPTDLSYAGVLSENSEQISYIFYKTNKKLSNKNSEGIFVFFDKNLKEIKKEVIILNKKTKKLIEVKNNGKIIAVSFYNKEKKELTYDFYNNLGEKLDFDYKLSYPKNFFALEAHYKEIQKVEEWIFNYPVKNAGFLFSEFVKRKRYKFSFIGNDNKTWIYKSPEGLKNRVTASPIYADDKNIIIIEKEWASVYDRQPNKIKAIILDTKTGKELFAVVNNYEKKPKFFTKALSAKNGNIILFGEYYKIGHKFYANDYNDGFFIEVYSKTGELLSKNLLSFGNPNLRKAFSIDNKTKQKDFGSIYFYDILEADGNYYAIGERYIRDVQGFTVLKGIIKSTFTFLNSNNWNSIYTLGNLVLIKLDNETKIIDIKSISKENSISGVNSLHKWPLFNLRQMKNEYNTDYVSSIVKENKLENIYFNNRIEKKDNLEYSIRKVAFKDIGNDVLEISKYNVINEEETYRLLNNGDNEILLIKYNKVKDEIILKVLK